MGFDFSNASGEAFGNIEDVFFTKNGKSITPESHIKQDSKINLSDLNKSLQDKSAELVHTTNNSSSGTVITISKEVLDDETDLSIELTEQEERRMNTSSVRNKSYIDINTGEVIVIIEKTELYNGTHLYTVKHENEKMITYPRSKFVGKAKQFIPKDFYIREAERAIEDSIDTVSPIILEALKYNQNLEETSDGKYLELLLDTPIEIIGGMMVPDKIQIPVKRLFDLEYKMMMLESVICMDNKIASLLFTDIWF